MSRRCELGDYILQLCDKISGKRNNKLHVHMGFSDNLGELGRTATIVRRDSERDMLT